ncbi:MAG: hypothetical protein AAGA55_05700 [Planctomycetota bacterium]
MNLHRTVATILLIPLTGCSFPLTGWQPDRANIDGDLHARIVAELLRYEGDPHGCTTGCASATQVIGPAPGPGLVAGDDIAFSWFMAHGAAGSSPDEGLAARFPTRDASPSGPSDHGTR